MEQKEKILIVDDDRHIAELISLYLAKQDYETLCAYDGLEALNAFSSFMPDLVILDIMLPGMDGYQVCRKIRSQHKTPILMLSAKGETFDKVLGLDLGADDYMVKPFELKELVARVKAVLRRTQPSEEDPADQKDSIQYGSLVINRTDFTVTLSGKKIDMPPKELELLYVLVKNPNRVFTRSQLLDRIWGSEFQGDDRTVDVHIKRIRKKLVGYTDASISTIWGIGYKFEVPDR